MKVVFTIGVLEEPDLRYCGRIVAKHPAVDRDCDRFKFCRRDRSAAAVAP